MRFLPFALLASLALAGCNTMAGAGQDLQNAGANLQSSATGAPPPPAPQNNFNTGPITPPPPTLPPESP
ncbi:MAG: entericidin A/B family lipoprotein [Acetobacteraceae bacterium]|nr:entericidin A/B family lipoprotein [Acetobacteraceae bacterium]